jgi:hypothetical protein
MNESIIVRQAGRTGTVPRLVLVLAALLLPATGSAASPGAQQAAERAAAEKASMEKLAAELAGLNHDLVLRAHYKHHKEFKLEAQINKVDGADFRERFVSLDEAQMKCLLDALLALKRAGRWPRHIAGLITESHGSEADAQFFSAPDILSRYGRYSASGYDELFGPHAQIAFHACAVAGITDGPTKIDGVKFLIGMGKKFLAKNGGSIWAPVGAFVGMPVTFKAAGGPLLPQNIGSVMGWVKVVVEPGGSATTSYCPYGFIESQEIAQRLFNRVATIEEAKRLTEVLVAEKIITTAAELRRVQVETGEKLLQTLGINASLRVQGEARMIAALKTFIRAYGDGGRCTMDQCRAGVAKVFELDVKDVLGLVGRAAADAVYCVGGLCARGARAIGRAGENVEKLEQGKTEAFKR